VASPTMHVPARAAAALPIGGTTTGAGGGLSASRVICEARPFPSIDASTHFPTYGCKFKPAGARYVVVSPTTPHVLADGSRSTSWPRIVSTPLVTGVIGTVCSVIWVTR